MSTPDNGDFPDFFRDESLVADPYPFLAELRERCPVQPEPHHDVVMVTGYDEATAVFGDAETFSSAAAVTGPFPGFPVDLSGRPDHEVSELIERHRDELPMSDQIITFDPPTHTSHRALLMGLITPKRLKENEDFMWRLADQALEPYLARGGGEFITEFAGPFTLMVIADLLGVPESDRAEFAARMGNLGEAGVGSTGEGTMEHSPLEYLYEKFSGYIDDRRRNPRADTLSEMAATTFPDGSTPEVIDVVRLASNLYTAGQETTVRLLSTALKLLAERRDLQDLLRAEPNRIPNFIEETLRWESPVKGDFRLARAAATIGGVDVPAGSTLMVCNGAANRDPQQFENPDTFDVARPNARRHIAFGRGVHSCPGAPLARAEARVCLERLLARTTHIGLSEAEHGPVGDRRFSYVPTYILRGLTALHLEVTPR
ncbi:MULTISPECIES: cytochrome P450 [unclassified Mycolicibacterium]|uniref:cytochrome P450 n=1 Tax=unclassified Mycolicibacterium TaxID=2636767 RepID=UPI0012DC999F|nr:MULTISPECIES: cytochrome P450 [unclassified Mycolicibacterium]MUL83121.1 cytochrome P450 [Mycolicibacterium sp. CBMA 329]MUL89456.1 cytochrome P450 [Mycolicibacterium sp. CBMA 331]MUL99145.1 cytochrome P450 [Mycolicibacterium sp. CBMA 334]MUM25706.1 cytochrome P450 [Mycolicibacterium sp. CBMA 295]MUM38972.1 cytochrome P450 [Mycolicibacterium sp. CBMA 247]